MSRWTEALEVPRPRGEKEALHLLVNSTGLKLYGAGEWLKVQHSTTRRKVWRKLDLVMETDTGRIVASVHDANDDGQVGPLLKGIVPCRGGSV